MNPFLVRCVLFPLHEGLKRKPTFRRLREFERTQWLPDARFEEYRLRRLRELLEFAHAHVPYYRALMDEHGFAPAAVQSVRDLQRLPVLTRDIIRTRFEDLRARVRRPRVQRRSTGGSSGNPVTVLVDMHRMGAQEAARLRAHRWFGLEPGVRETIVWGSPLEITRQDRTRSLRDRLLNSQLLSAFDLGDQALAEHADAILRFRPAKMYGYASALYLLARYFERAHLPPPPGLRAVFTTAEPLFDFQRAAIRRAFGCAVATEYGSRDAGLTATECPAGGLHIAAESIYAEILDADESGLGEVTLTNLDSLAFPIIRYRTGDLGSLNAGRCECGRSLPRFRAIEGRQTDFLVTPSGRVLHALSVIYILRELSAVREFRVVQEGVDRVVVQLVADRPLVQIERRQLVADFSALLGSGVTTTVDEVRSIPRTPSGKFRYVESRVAHDVLADLLGGGGPCDGVNSTLHVQTSAPHGPVASAHD